MGNDEWVESLRAALAHESRFLAEVIGGLIDIEERRLHLEVACSSMFEFCIRKLEMSEGEAFRRLTAARLAKRFPSLLEAIRDRRLNLSGAVLLRDLFTESNVDALIVEASGKNRRELQALIAKYAPRPDVPPAIRKLPASRSAKRPPQQPSPVAAVASSMSVAGSPSPPPPHAAGLGEPSLASSPLAARGPSSIPVASQLLPLSEQRHKVQFTASTELREKLERAQSLMRHSNANGDLAHVVEKALDALIAKLERAKAGAAARPRASVPPASADAVTRSARREVMERDGGRCSFVSHSGDRCGSQDFLEIDHRHPRALGGTSDAANLRLLCRAHNRLAAEQAFGSAFVASKIQARRRHLRDESRPPAEPRAPT